MGDVGDELSQKLVEDRLAACVFEDKGDFGFSSLPFRQAGAGDAQGSQMPISHLHSDFRLHAWHGD